MKKRNMAITIAAVSAATSVAPALAFADTLDNQVIASTDVKAVAELKGEIEGFLNTKYTNDAKLMADYKYNGASEAAKAGSSVYTVNVTVDGVSYAKPEDKTIATMDQLDVALAKLNDTNHKFLNIEVIDNGHKTVNGQIVNWKEGTYTQDDINNLYTELTKASAKPKAQEPTAKTPESTAKTPESTTKTPESTPKAQEDGKSAPVVSKLAAATPKAIEDVTRVNADTLSLKLKNNDNPLVIKTGDTILDLKAPIYSQDKSGSYLDKYGKVIAGVTTNDGALDDNDTVVTGFAVEKEALQPAQNGQPSDFEAPRNYGVDFEAVKTTNYKAQDLYDFSIGRFTPQGDQLVNFIAEYDAAKPDGTTANVGAVADGKLTITFPVDKTDAMKSKVTTNVATGNFAQVVITGSNNELNTLKQALGGDTKIKVLAGADRYNTAVQVSKATFVDKGQSAANGKIQAKSVVLVSGTALADGLTATPFAAQQSAPVLLTSKDKVSGDTMKEIKRVIGETGTINVIGGENTISKAVETQLKAAGYDIKRISGDDRYETSLAIANEMKTGADKTVYIAGGYAEADAMSIAPIAARAMNGVATDTTPIILANEKTGLSSNAVKYIAENKDASTYIIGGADRAPESIKAQLKDAGMTKATERLSGDDRQGTNAAVIKEFATAENMKNLYVAKSDNQGLVDSLSAGVLAAQTNSPVVLATNSVNAEQQSVIKAKNPTITNKTQIGEGIAAQVWSTINNLFTK